MYTDFTHGGCIQISSKNAPYRAGTCNCSLSTRVIVILMLMLVSMWYTPHPCTRDACASFTSGIPFLTSPTSSSPTIPFRYSTISLRPRIISARHGHRSTIPARGTQACSYASLVRFSWRLGNAFRGCKTRQHPQNAHRRLPMRS